MKKILTICVFAFALLISSQGFAQEIKANNTTISKAEVKENVAKLTSTLDLSQEQKDAFIKAYINKEKALKENEDNAKVQQKFLSSLKGVLTEKQITKLKSLSQKK